MIHSLWVGKHSECTHSHDAVCSIKDERSVSELTFGVHRSLLGQLPPEVEILGPTFTPYEFLAHLEVVQQAKPEVRERRGIGFRSYPSSPLVWRANLLIAAEVVVLDTGNKPIHHDPACRDEAGYPKRHSGPPREQAPKGQDCGGKNRQRAPAGRVGERHVVDAAYSSLK